MNRKKISRFLTLLAAGVLAAGTVTTTGFADVSYEAPSQGMEADNDTYLTGSAYAASTVILSILGVNITSSNGAGIYNAGGESSAYGTDSSNLGIFGSDVNDNPDPYLYNYFYNLNSTESGDADYDADALADWTATPYTLRWDANKSGPQGQASGTATITVDGVTKTCNPAFFYEPDLIIGEANGYSEQLESYQSEYNADYDPTIISAVSTSGERQDGLGLEYNMFEMSANLVEIGAAVDALADETGKITRYEQEDGTGSAYEIATDYDKYNRGLYYYAQSAFDNGDLTKINYVSGLSYDADSESWLVTQDSSRTAQYASGIGTEVYDLLNTEDGYTFSDGTVITQDDMTTVEVTNSGMGGGPGGSGGGMGGGGATGTADGETGGGIIETTEESGGDTDAGGEAPSGDNAGGEAPSGEAPSGDSAGEAPSGDDAGEAPDGEGPSGDSDSESDADSGDGDTSEGGGDANGGMGGMSSSTGGFYLTTDQLIEILQVEGEDGTTYEGIVLGSVGDDDVYTDLVDAGISFLGNLPSCVYGMTMQTTENGMGIAFYLSYFYYEQDKNLNPVSVMGYWIEHFYHVSDIDAMQTVITNMISESDLSSEYSAVDGASLDIDQYDEDAIESLIIDGISYYRYNVRADLIAEESAYSGMEFWSTLDATVGIGSDTELAETGITAGVSATETDEDTEEEASAEETEEDAEEDSAEDTEETGEDSAEEVEDDSAEADNGPAAEADEE